MKLIIFFVLFINAKRYEKPWRYTAVRNIIETSGGFLKIILIQLAFDLRVVLSRFNDKFKLLYARDLERIDTDLYAIQ